MFTIGGVHISDMISQRITYKWDCYIEYTLGGVHISEIISQLARYKLYSHLRAVHIGRFRIVLNRVESDPNGFRKWNIKPVGVAPCRCGEKWVT